MKKYFLVGILAIAFTSCNAASFNCSKVKSKSEILICTDSELSTLDDALPAAVRQARATFENKKEFDYQQIQAWKHRQQCDDRACVKDWYTERLAILQAATATNTPPAQQLISELTNGNTAYFSYMTTSVGKNLSIIMALSNVSCDGDLYKFNKYVNLWLPDKGLRGQGCWMSWNKDEIVTCPTDEKYRPFTNPISKKDCVKFNNSDFSKIINAQPQATALANNPSTKTRSASIDIPTVYDRLVAIQRINENLSDKDAVSIIYRSFPKCKNVEFAGPYAGSTAEIHALATMTLEMQQTGRQEVIFRQTKKVFASGVECRPDSVGVVGCMGTGYSKQSTGELGYPTLTEYKKYGDL